MRALIVETPYRRACLSILLLAVTLLSSLLWGQKNSLALANTTGGVTVNGASIPRTTVVASGDHIQTAGDGGVTLAMAGSIVAIPANSDLLLRRGLLQLNSGTAEVNTRAGLRAQVEHHTVVPAGSAAARYKITRMNATILVSVFQGSAMLEGSERTRLDAGMSATFQEGVAMSRPAIRKAGTNATKILTGVGASGGATAAAATAASRRKTEDASPVVP